MDGRRADGAFQLRTNPRLTLFRSRDSERALPRHGTWLLWALLSCASVNDASNAIGQAQTALDGARAGEADRYAPYETTLSDMYLAKAREEQARGKGAEAQKLGEEALKYAQTASRKSAERRAAVSTPPPAATIQHPRNLGGSEAAPESQPPKVPKQ